MEKTTQDIKNLMDELDFNMDLIEDKNYEEAEEELCNQEGTIKTILELFRSEIGDDNDE